MFLEEDPETWLTSIYRAWAGLVDPSVVTEHYVVMPTPLPAAEQQDAAAHVILVQRQIEGEKAVILTTLDEEVVTNQAHFTSSLVTRRVVLHKAGLDGRCFGSASAVVCAAWHFGRPIGDTQPFPVDNGFALLLTVYPLQVRAPCIQSKGAHVQSAGRDGKPCVLPKKMILFRVDLPSVRCNTVKQSSKHFAKAVGRLLKPSSPSQQWRRIVHGPSDCEEAGIRTVVAWNEKAVTNHEKWCAVLLDVTVCVSPDSSTALVSRSAKLVPPTTVVPLDCLQS